jgi:Ca-activated chloride channel homolog
LDGVYLALQQMKTARHERKAIFVISDGGDNHSRFTATEVADLALESGTAVYAVELPGITNAWLPDGGGILEELADKTGGRDYAVSHTAVSDAAQRIGTELRSQYVLGYLPENLAPDGRYHRVHVKVVPPPGQTKITSYWRRGYFAPRN